MKAGISIQILELYPFNYNGLLPLFFTTIDRAYHSVHSINTITLNGFSTKISLKTLSIAAAMHVFWLGLKENPLQV